MPAAVHVVSPFCDLALPADELAACYLHDADPAAPQVSPLRADLEGLPPLLIQAAVPEALFPAAQRLAGQARGAGVPVTFSPVDDSVHSFILFDFLPEASRAVAGFAAFAHQDPRSSLDSGRAGGQAGGAGHGPGDGGGDRDGAGHGDGHGDGDGDGDGHGPGRC